MQRKDEWDQDLRRRRRAEKVRRQRAETISSRAVHAGPDENPCNAV